jgi:hypothetical protein
LTPNAGLLAVGELCDRLRVASSIDRAVGPIKTRDRGHSAGDLLVGIAAAQLAGEDFLVGLDRVRADAAGQRIAPVPGLCSTTAAGLARRMEPAQWHAVETGLAWTAEWAVSLLPASVRQPHLVTLWRRQIAGTGDGLTKGWRSAHWISSFLLLR